jgi:hypothetical protein
MSRYTAGCLLSVSAQWLQSVSRPEDNAFTDLMTMVGLTLMYNATSESMMGQSIDFRRVMAMQMISLIGIEKCPSEPPAI